MLKFSDVQSKIDDAGTAGVWIIPKMFPRAFDLDDI